MGMQRQMRRNASAPGIPMPLVAVSGQLPMRLGAGLEGARKCFSKRVRRPTLAMRIAVDGCLAAYSSDGAPNSMQRCIAASLLSLSPRDLGCPGVAGTGRVGAWRKLWKRRVRFEAELALF